MNEPTRAQQRVLDFIQAEVNAGRPIPTLREIAERFGFRSHRAAACHLEALKRKGFVESEPGKARSLRVTSPLAKLRGRVMDIPLFGSIPAGFAREREQEAEGCVSVDIESIGFKPARNAFALRVAGDSMIGRHIVDGDIVVLEHGPEPRPGDVVAALIDGESTLKTFLRRNGKPYLKAENPKYPDLIPAQELMIQGVFRALIRRAEMAEMQKDE
jgi:repressor LexA